MRELDCGIQFREVDLRHLSGEIGLGGWGDGCQWVWGLREGGGGDGEVEELEEAWDGGDGTEGEGGPGTEVADVPPEMGLHAAAGREGEVEDEVDGLGWFGEVGE